MNEIERRALLIEAIEAENQKHSYVEIYDERNIELILAALHDQAENQTPRVKLHVPENPGSKFEFACGSCEAFVFASDRYCGNCGKRLELEEA